MSDPYYQTYHTQRHPDLDNRTPHERAIDRIESEIYGIKKVITEIRDLLKPKSGCCEFHRAHPECGKCGEEGNGP